MNALAAPPRRPRAGWLLGLGALALTAISIAVLDWDLARFFDARERAHAFERMRVLASALAAPDLSSETLRLGLKLSLDTLAIARVVSTGISRRAHAITSSVNACATPRPLVSRSTYSRCSSSAPGSSTFISRAPIIT